MSTTYEVRQGDTFDKISRVSYGTEQNTQLIKNANPGVLEPLTSGITLIIPDDPTAPQDIKQQAPAENKNEISLLIGGERFRFWETLRTSHAIDSMDTAEFSAPFEPDAPNFRETFKPFAFQPLVVSEGGNPLFTGVMVSVNPSVENKKKIITASGYATPGVLNDCNSPASSFPLEFNNQGLREIATTMAAPFGIAVEFEAEPGPIFERVAAAPTKKVLAFLVDLARQRNLIISNTPDGKLLFRQSVEVGNPVARLRQGESPLLSVTPTFNPQQYYSHITAMNTVVIGGKGAQYTAKNTKLEGTTRPLTFNAPDALDAEVKESANAKIGRMFGNMAAYSIRLSTWRDPLGNRWAPNTTVTLTAPGAMVYNEYEFVVRSCVFDRDPLTEVATLGLSLPGSFSGKIPESLPWD